MPKDNTKRDLWGAAGSARIGAAGCALEWSSTPRPSLDRSKDRQVIIRIIGSQSNKTPPRTLVAGAAQACLRSVGIRQQQQGRGEGEQAHHMMGFVELCVEVVRVVLESLGVC